MISIPDGQIHCVSKDPQASEPSWLGEGSSELVWLKGGDNDNTSLIICDALAPDKPYTAGTLSGPVSSLKLYNIKPGMIAIAVAGQANPDGTLFNPKDVPKPASTARVYDALFVRHWDTYVTQQRNSIFTGLLQRSQPRVTERKGLFNLLGFTNALRGTGLECPRPPFGGVDHFDIGREGIVFTAKEPDLDPATHTKCGVWFVPKEDVMDLGTPNPRRINHPGLNGAVESPVFSPRGKEVAFLQMAEDGYEADRNRLVVVFNATDENKTTARVFFDKSEEAALDISPSSILWSVDGKSLYVQAEHVGNGCLFSVDLEKPQYRQLTTTGCIVDVKPASATSNHLFLSSNSLIDNSIYSLFDPGVASLPPKTIASASQSGTRFGLSPSQVSSLWWKGANDHPVHAWMVRPSFFRSEHKYPLAYLIHGGPQGAWLDQWSTRWNPAVFAEQGYVVICPNPTGSTSYGQDFTDAIRNQWGGLPYEDLVKGFEYIESDLPFVDTSRAVALGASYGGYMMNWFQGHPLGRKFKTLVCHDGVFSMTAQLASEEQYFPTHDLGGPIWKRQEMFDKWDPSRFTGNWETPMLVIHNELDYRLTMAEGLAAFNVLQMRGIESRFLSFPDENHWVLKQENSLVWHLVVINWINRFVALPGYRDKDGRDGSEYVRQGKRKEKGSLVMR